MLRIKDLFHGVLALSKGSGHGLHISNITQFILHSCNALLHQNLVDAKISTVKSHSFLTWRTHQGISTQSSRVQHKIHHSCH